jgi:hypothetical protein
LSTRLAAFADTLEHTREPGEFWPSWLVARLRDTDAFDVDDKVLLKDLAFQSFDRATFFRWLAQLEGVPAVV